MKEELCPRCGKVHYSKFNNERCKARHEIETQNESPRLKPVAAKRGATIAQITKFLNDLLNGYDSEPARANPAISHKARQRLAEAAKRPRQTRAP